MRRWKVLTYSTMLPPSQPRLQIVGDKKERKYSPRGGGGFHSNDVQRNLQISFYIIGLYLIFNRSRERRSFQRVLISNNFRPAISTCIYIGIEFHFPSPGGSHKPRRKPKPPPPKKKGGISGKSCLGILIFDRKDSRVARL